MKGEYEMLTTRTANLSTTMLLAAVNQLQFRPNKSPGIPRLTLYHILEELHRIRALVMIHAPVADAIADRVEGELALKIIRSGGRRRQHGLGRKLPLIEMQQAEIEIKVRLSVLNPGSDARQSLLRFFLFVSAAQQRVAPICAINQAVVIFTKPSRSFKATRS